MNLNIHIIFQRSQVLGNKIEMEITQLVEQNTTLLRLGLHLEFNDARHRVAAHLQRNIDRSKYIKSIERIYSIYQRILGHEKYIWVIAYKSYHF